MKKIIIILISSLSFVATLCGQDNEKHPIDVRLDSCLNDSNSYTTMDMMLCYSAAEKEWNTELDKYYQLLVDALPKQARSKLQKEQRLWLKFFKSDDAFSITLYYELLEGTMWRIVAAQRSMNVVRSRALDLKEYYENFK
ncbi:hypothetical protein FACS1894180_6420 [Bacteroidia bacterium]|nr:hypothetical protein FACS1894178_5310 [Bacteroidia bacterium]GHV44723.1 hypothetical protein FACS1894180_6420 [Bacteroidia bacterium]